MAGGSQSSAGCSVLTVVCVYYVLSLARLCVVVVVVCRLGLSFS